MSGKVYSYLRFSTPKQAAGASRSRQLDYAKKWAADNNMVLDASLSMRDEGLSAFHQRHLKYGALGIFIEAINAGKIATGSVLIVEGLDRLSRAAPMQAQAQLQNIISAGVEVVTASDGKRYSSKSLADNPMDIIYAVLVMIRAHEESATKSKRVADQLQRKCEGWLAGTYRGKISCGANPSWVEWTGEQFRLKPGVADTVRHIVLRFTEGYGGAKIIDELRAKGISATGTRQANNINQLVCAQPHLFIGNRKVLASGKEFLLENYYPPLLTAEEFARLRIAIEQRRVKPRNVVAKATFVSVLTGGGITYCGHCGAAVIARNQKRNPLKNGAVYYRRVICPRCEVAGKGVSGCNADVLEKAVFLFCADQINLDALTQSSEPQRAKLLIERGELLARIGENEKRAAKYMDAVMADDAAAPQMLIQRLREMETKLVSDKARAAVLDAELAVGDTNALPDSEKWLTLRDGTLGLDNDARMAARRLILDTFSKIQVFSRGAFPDSPESVVDLLLIAKGGTRRWLRVDRKTGELIRGLNFDNHVGQDKVRTNA